MKLIKNGVVLKTEIKRKTTLKIVKLLSFKKLDNQKFIKIFRIPFLKLSCMISIEKPN